MTHDTVIFHLPCSCKYAKRPPRSGYVQVAMWETSQAPCPPENAAALSSPLCPFQRSCERRRFPQKCGFHCEKLPENDISWGRGRPCGMQAALLVSIDCSFRLLYEVRLSITGKQGHGHNNITPVPLPQPFLMRQLRSPFDRRRKRAAFYSSCPIMIQLV